MKTMDCEFEKEDDPLIRIDENTGEKVVNGSLRLCKADGCYNDSQSKGLCGYHYDEKYKKGYRNLNEDKKACNNSDSKYGFDCCCGNIHQQKFLESNHIKPRECGGGDENENSEWLCMQGHKIISQIQQATKHIVGKKALKGVSDVEKIKIITFRVEETFSRSKVSYSNRGGAALGELIHRFYRWYSESNS